jgi:molybdopterin converting factor subunit 1
MQVRVLLFGVLKDLAGHSSDVINLPGPATAADVLDHYKRKLMTYDTFLASVAISVNQEYVAGNHPLRAGDEVALLPPVSGGLDDSDRHENHQPYVRLVRETIVPHDIVPVLEKPEDGAIVIFDGIVRNHSRGRRTIYLEYDSYEEMALKQLREMAMTAKSQFAVRDVAIVHRLGRIEIGQSSIVIAVFSAHRAPAFEACRWVIDTLKRTVPIWKKEFFEDGAVWADGEPFPDEITAGTNRGSPASK